MRSHHENGMLGAGKDAQEKAEEQVTDIPLSVVCKAPGL